MTRKRVDVTDIADLDEHYAEDSFVSFLICHPTKKVFLTIRKMKMIC